MKLSKLMDSETLQVTWADPEDGGGGGGGGGAEGGTGCPEPPSLENLKAIGFLRTGLDPLENHKTIQPSFNVQPASETPFKCRFAGRLMMAHLLDDGPLSPLCKISGMTKIRCQSWTRDGPPPLEETFWIRT